MWKRILFFVFILFAVELGLFLVALPWSVLWERNIILTLFPSLRPIWLSNYSRGAVTGLGIIDLWIGLSGLWHFRENLARIEKAVTDHQSSVVSHQSSVIGSGRTDD